MAEKRKEASSGKRLRGSPTGNTQQQDAKRPPERKADGKSTPPPSGRQLAFTSVFVALVLRLPTKFSLSRQHKTTFICCSLAYKPPKAAIHSTRLCPINACVYNVCNFALRIRVRAHGLDLARASLARDSAWHLVASKLRWPKVKVCHVSALVRLINSAGCLSFAGSFPVSSVPLHRRILKSRQGIAAPGPE